MNDSGVFMGADLVPLRPLNFSNEDAQALKIANEMGMGETAEKNQEEALPTQAELESAYALADASFRAARERWLDNKRALGEGDKLSEGQMKLARDTMDKLTVLRDKVKNLKRERMLAEQSMNPQQPYPPYQQPQNTYIPFPNNPGQPPQQPNPNYYQPQPPIQPIPFQSQPSQTDYLLNLIYSELQGIKQTLAEVLKNTTPPKQPKLKKKIENPVTE